MRFREYLTEATWSEVEKHWESKGYKAFHCKDDKKAKKFIDFIKNWKLHGKHVSQSKAVLIDSDDWNKLSNDYQNKIIDWYNENK